MRLLALPVAAAAFLATPALAGPRPDDVSQRMLDNLVEVSGVPGMGAAVWQGDRIVWTGSSGLRDVDRRLPVDGETVFRLASVSKLLTATAAAKLHEQGKLDIDAPATTILPWLKNDWAPITARQLAAHVSGLPHYNDNDRATLGRTRYPTSRAAVAIFEGRPLLQPPGDKYVYSSWGFTLLGALVEQRSGMLFSDYVMREVTPGLAIMRDATDGPNPNATVAYEFADRTPVRARPIDFSYTWGGGGMAATPSALATFGGRFLANRIVAKETVEWMLRPASFNDGRAVEDEGYVLGFGWRLSPDEDGVPTVHHAGVSPGVRSALVGWRDDGMAVALLSNALWTASIDRSARMIAAPHRPIPKTLVARACPVSATRFAGTFNGAPIAGGVTFSAEGGLCVGSLESGGELQQWLSGGSQKAAGGLKLVGLDGAGGLARAGLVTPYGIYDWRAQPDGTFKATFGGTRELIVRLD
jgi:serine beta-lactamase-like protein LACTB, mitochondrial